MDLKDKHEKKHEIVKEFKETEEQTVEVEAVLAESQIKEKTRNILAEREKLSKRKPITFLTEP